MDRFIKLLYSFAIGVSVALFVGFSISAVYPSPSWQEEERCYSQVNYDKEPTAEEQKQTEECYKSIQEERSTTEEKRAYYMMASAVVLAVVYVVLYKKTRLDDSIKDGVGFGVVFVSIASLAASSSNYIGEPNRYQPVLAAALTLASALLVTQVSLAKQNKSKTKKSKK